MKGTLLAIFAAVAAISHAQSIVWDQGPGTGDIFYGGYNQGANGANMLDLVQFQNTTIVDTYYHYDSASLIGSFRFRIFADANGQPGELLLEQGSSDDFRGLVGWDTFNNPIYEHRLHMPVNPVTFEGGVRYWIGAMYSQ